jgi:hypothetical protein
VHLTFALTNALTNPSNAIGRRPGADETTELGVEAEAGMKPVAVGARRRVVR